MGTASEVEDRIPGLKFSVVSAVLSSGSTAKGTLVGTITLRCDIKDTLMFRRATEKLNGLKIFSTVTEEIMDALSDELNSTDRQLRDALAREAALTNQLRAKEDEVSMLRTALADIGTELGIE